MTVFISKHQQLVNYVQISTKCLSKEMVWGVQNKLKNELLRVDDVPERQRHHQFLCYIMPFLIGTMEDMTWNAETGKLCLILSYFPGNYGNYVF